MPLVVTPSPTLTFGCAVNVGAPHVADFARCAEELGYVFTFLADDERGIRGQMEIAGSQVLPAFR